MFVDQNQAKDFNGSTVQHVTDFNGHTCTCTTGRLLQYSVMEQINVLYKSASKLGDRQFFTTVIDLEEIDNSSKNSDYDL